MWRTVGAGAAGAVVGVGSALFAGLPPETLAFVGAVTGVTLPMAPRLSTLLACGAAAFGTWQLHHSLSASGLLFISLVVVGELTRTADRPKSGDVAAWSPAIFWCAAVALFFAAVGSRNADPNLSSSAILAFAIPPALVAARVASVVPFVIAAVLSAIAAAVQSGEALRLGHAVGATLPLMTWSLAHVVRIRAQRLRDVNLAGSLSGVLAGDIATCAAAGYTPRGSGTVGAVTALPFAWWFASFELVPRLAIVAGLIALSIVVAYRYCAGGTEDLDPSEVVFDEFIGVLIPLAVMPWTWGWVIASFVAFRFFDIAKPGPVGWMDRNIKSPAGIMLDDVAAGLLAAGVLLIAQRLIG